MPGVTPGLCVPPPPRRNHYCPLLFYSRPAQRWGKEKKTPVTCAHSCLINFPSLSGRHDQGGARGVFYRAGGEGRRSDRGGAGGGRRRREDAHRLSLLGREESAHQQRGGRLPLQRSVCGSHCAALHSYAPSTGCFTRTLQHCALFNSSSSSSHMWKLFNAPWLQGWVIISRFNFKPFLLTFFFFFSAAPETNQCLKPLLPSHTPGYIIASIVCKDGDPHPAVKKITPTHTQAHPPVTALRSDIWRSSCLTVKVAPSVSFIELYAALAALTINSWHSRLRFLVVSASIFHSADEINEVKQQEGLLF